MPASAWRADMLSLAGKVAIVTGGVQGIGGAETEALVRQGANVIVGDVRDDDGPAFVRQLNTGASTLRAHYQPLDVTRVADWERAVAKAEEVFGRLTTLVNNAGVPGRAGIEDTTEEGWDRTLGVDLKGTWLGMKTCIPAMRHGEGRHHHADPRRRRGIREAEHPRELHSPRGDRHAAQQHDST